MQRTVLVVDDDESTRFVLSRVMEDLGCAVVAIDDGAEVADLVAHRHFDLVVLDLHMPGMSGFEVLRQLHSPEGWMGDGCTTPTPAPVVVVSAETYPASITHARRLGAAAYLGKPVDLGLLEYTVRHLLGMCPTARPGSQPHTDD